jgi:hypothetical protein
MADVNITIGATITELTEKVGQAAKSLETLQTGVRALAAGLGITALVEFTSRMTELAEQAERTAAVLGISTVAAQELAGVSKLFGGEAQTLTISLERLQLNLQRAQNLTGAQANALKALGLSAQQVAAVPIDKQVNLFADAVKRLNDQGINPANALIPLFGRGVTTLIPLLVQGSAAVEAWKQRLIDVGSVMTEDTNKNLVSLGREMSLLRSSLEGLGETILNEFAAPLKDAAKEISAWIGHLANLNQAVGLGTYLTGYFTRWLELLTAEMNKDAAATETAQKALADYNAETEKAIVHLKEIIVTQAAADAKRSAAIPDDRGMRDRLKLAEEEFKKTESLITEVVDFFGLGEVTKTQLMEKAIREREIQEVEAGEKAVLANAKAEAEIEKLYAKMAADIQKQWKAVADTIASAINSQLRAVLAGTESLATAMKNIFADLVLKLIEHIVTLGIEWAVNFIYMQTIGRAFVSAAAADFISKMTADASLVYAGVFANLAPFMGPAAAEPATASAATVLAQLGNAPKFDLGTPLVLGTGLAMVHKGEAIVPAWANPANPTTAGQQTTNNFAGSNIGLNINAVDARSFANMVRNNPAAFLSLFERLAQRDSLRALVR